MELTGLTVPVMNWAATNLPEQWIKFQRHVELMFTGPLKEKSDEEKVSYFLIWVGDKGRDIHATWEPFTEDDAKHPQKYYEKFKAHVQPSLNPIFARYKFNNEVQGSDSIDAFVTRLRLSAVDCSFTNKEEMIRDRIVFGTNSARVREKLINKGEGLTLANAIQMAQAHEYSQQQLHSMAATNDVDAVQAPFKLRKRPQQQKRTKEYRERKFQNKESQCTHCGHNSHKQGSKCPAENAKCYKCGKLNHFANVCRSKNRNVYEVKCSNSNQGNEFSDSDSEEYQNFYVDTVNFSSTPDRAFTQINVGPSRSPVHFKIATGSAVDILPLSHFQKLKIKRPLETPDNKLTSYTGNMLPVRGMVRLHLRYKDKTCESMCYVVDSHTVPLLSLQSSVDLGLIQLTYSVENSISSCTAPISSCTAPCDKQRVMSEYGNLFEGVGVIPGESKLHIKPDAVPVINAPRRVPEALRDRFQKELQRMEKENIITKVTEPTEWVNSLVIVEKPKTGKLRICLDPKALNEAIKRPHYPMRTMEDVTSRLTDAKFFSILDITHAYWSVKLDQKSSLLTTFSTVFGRYRWLRLPYGISASSDIFMQKVDEIFEGLKGLTAIVDDILIYGKSREEHDANLRNALQRAKSKGIKFNPDKCIIGVTEVPFFGHLITSAGLKPDPTKLEAISKLDIPKNRQQLENVLGMANYLQKFSQNLAEVTSPMRSLLKKEVELIWDAAQTEAFSKMKTIITQSPVLAYFDHKQPVTLECDASKNGVGAAIIQNGHPVAFASRTLTETESRYANIERELLAILFGCTRFHQYVHGRHVTVHSDNKPLSSIMKKNLSVCPPRLQRMRLQLSKYDIDVRHVSGKQVPISDLLSRQPLKEKLNLEGLDLHVHTVLKSLNITDRRLESLKHDTQSDANMQLLKQTIIDGWPVSRADCNPAIVEFWNHRDELSSADDLIFRGQTLVIPLSARQQLIESVHQGHMGVEKYIQRAKDVMFWPGMSKQITDHVLQCAVCQKYRYSNAKEPLTPHDVPERPWQNIAADLFSYDNKDYLVTVDYYSRYFEVDALPNTQSITIIRKLKVHLARYGICDKLVTDNGPQFSAEIFSDFAKEWGFSHVTSSPLHPISNGLAEKTVSIVKRIFKKAHESHRDPYVAILEYRNTPLECGFSPNQLLMGRRTKSILPVTNAQLQPKTVSPKLVREKMQQQKQKQKSYYDKSAKKLPPLNLNEYIRIQVKKLWEPAKVIKIHKDQSYSVQTSAGGIYRRNRRLINKTKEKFPEIQEFAPDILMNPLSFPGDRKISTAKDNDHAMTHDMPSQTNPHYLTRSGREVKLNKHYYNENWINN